MLVMIAKLINYGGDYVNKNRTTQILDEFANKIVLPPEGPKQRP